MRLARTLTCTDNSSATLRSQLALAAVTQAASAHAQVQLGRACADARRDSHRHRACQSWTTAPLCPPVRCRHLLFSVSVPYSRYSLIFLSQTTSARTSARRALSAEHDSRRASLLSKSRFRLLTLIFTRACNPSAAFQAHGLRSPRRRRRQEHAPTFQLGRTCAL